MNELVTIRYGCGSSVAIFEEDGARCVTVSIPIPRGYEADQYVLEQLAGKVHGAALARFREAVAGIRHVSPIARKTIVDLCYEKLWGKGFPREQVADIAERLADPIISWLGEQADK